MSTIHIHMSQSRNLTNLRMSHSQLHTHFMHASVEKVYAHVGLKKIWRILCDCQLLYGKNVSVAHSVVGKDTNFRFSTRHVS